MTLTTSFMTKREQLLSKIKELISNKEPGADIILFGSRARNDFHADSDWDILVLMDKDKISLADEQSLRHSLYDIELDTGEVLSLLIYSKNEWNSKLKVTPLYKNVNKEGVKL
jgi:predicted nucleotidyltransferase